MAHKCHLPSESGRFNLVFGVGQPQGAQIARGTPRGGVEIEHWLGRVCNTFYMGSKGSRSQFGAAPDTLRIEISCGGISDLTP